MAQTIVIDPVTRLEGHLKIELDINNNIITAARASGTMFRGLEKILVGRDPFDAPVITARVCGVCPVSHAYVASVALELAAGFTPPKNARIVRNLILASNFLQSHILHFYHLSLLDFMKGPDMAPWKPSLQGDMRFTQAASEALFKNYDIALDMRRKTHSMGAIFAGRLPHPPSIIPGGVTVTITQERVNQFKSMLDEVSQFVTNLYAADVELLAQTYPEYLVIGKGSGNFISYGAFFENDAYTNTLFPSGIMYADGTMAEFDSSQISESVSSSWYVDQASPTHPAQGKTEMSYPKAGAYSWTKAPRYRGQVMEAGPFARMKVAGLIKDEISVISRHKARVIESKELVTAMQRWLSELQIEGPVYNSFTEPPFMRGAGTIEAPRGALGHWFQVENGKIANYQIITPTCFNASPTDEKGTPGAIEASLTGTTVSNPEEAVEALRIVHSFDPCLACAVH